MEKQDENVFFSRVNLSRHELVLYLQEFEFLKKIALGKNFRAPNTFK
jgi:hypothetical protein